MESLAYGTQLHTFHITTLSLGWLGSIIEKEIRGRVVMKSTLRSRIRNATSPTLATLLVINDNLF